MKEHINNFLFHCKFEKNLDEKTLKAYKTDLKQFLLFCKKHKKINSLKKIDKTLIKSYLESIMNSFKAKTVKRKMATLKAFFNFLQFENEIDVNPFNKIRIKIKEGKRVPRTIEPFIIKKLYKYLYQRSENLEPSSYSYRINMRDIAVVELLFATGLRVSELSNLKISAVDLKNHSIRIIGKGDKERIIPICNTHTSDSLKKYYNLFSSEILDEGYFFINRLNKRFSEQSIRLMLKKHISAINIDKNITPHMFRHSVATMLLENEVDIRYIQDLLGHSSINTTQIYLSVNKKKQRSIITKKHPRNNL